MPSFSEVPVYSVFLFFILIGFFWGGGIFYFSVFFMQIISHQTNSVSVSQGGPQPVFEGLNPAGFSVLPSKRKYSHQGIWYLDLSLKI